MDDLLSEFLTETAESLDVVDVELVKFEKEPNNTAILDNIFRLVHTIKGTCGFLGLPRLEALAHAAETLMGKFRDGVPVTEEAVSLILITIDRIKDILVELETAGSEPEGDDADLITQLDVMALGEAAVEEQADMASAPADPAPEPEPAPEAEAAGGDELQIVVRETKPGEVSLDDLERAFQEAEGPELEILDPSSFGEAAAAPAAPAVAKPEPAPASTGKAGKAAKAAGDDNGQKHVKTQTIRVNVDALEVLMTMVSELVLTRNQLLEMVRRLDDSEFEGPLQRLSSVTAELQEGVMKTRMQPVGNAWQKLPRIVRDLANELNKKIDLQMHGAETELDRQVLELIKDPLTHMVRNSADHGVEDVETRIARGKDETGTIKLSAFHEGGHIIIEIVDDGRGLNMDAIKKKMLDNGLATEAEIEKMTTAQIQKQIFAAGFSTAKVVTNVSGRGVGMDVVRTNIETIGGSVDVRSVEGRGSTFSIKIPLTLAIISALVVKSGGHRFAIPQLNVVELVRANTESDHRIELINQTPVLRLRNRLLPLVHLTSVLDSHMSDIAGKAAAMNREAEDVASEGDGEAMSHDDKGATKMTGVSNEAFIIVTQVGGQTFGIVVDSVFDTEEIVVKPMSALLKDINVFSGNTILGDGSVIMIVDPNGIAQLISHEVAEDADAKENKADAAVAGAGEKISLLLFKDGSEDPKAVPLSLVTRLEQLEVDTIEEINHQEMVQYRGQLMPLLRMGESGEGEKISKGRQPLLVFSDGRRTMGLAVDQIEDIVETQLEIELSSGVPGKVGSAVVKGKATEIIDVGYYVTQAFDDWMSQENGGNISGRRILLIDDSVFFRDMLKPVLQAAGYEVTTADSAMQALRLKEQGIEFDVIVSDIEMPEIDGYQFAESLQDDESWGRVPIVALSSQATSEELQRGRAAGFYDYVGKFDREGLIKTLGDSLAARKDAA